MSDVLIIIPAYNEEANIERVVDHLVQNFPQYDYVVVNDQLDQTIADVEAIITSEKLKTSRNSSSTTAKTTR